METLFHNVLNAITNSTQIHLLLLLPVAAGFIAFFNPCMLGIVPLLAERGARWQQGHKAALVGHIVVFTAGFLLSLTVWALFFTVFMQLAGLWVGLWSKLLALLYLAVSLYLFGVRLPKAFLPQAVGFYKPARPPSPYLSSALMGIFFGAAPSPCTTPLIIAVTGTVVPAFGNAVGLAVVLLYGLGHTLPLIFIVMLANKLNIVSRMRRFHGVFRFIMAVLLLALALYFFFYQPAMLPGDIYVPEHHP